MNRQNAMLQPTLQKEQVREIKTLDETKVKEITKEMESRLKGEVEKLKAAQDKLEDSLERWEKMSAKHQGLLPPTVISKNGTIHENKRQTYCFACDELAHQTWLAVRCIELRLWYRLDNGHLLEVHHHRARQRGKIWQWWSLKQRRFQRQREKGSLALWVVRCHHCRRDYDVVRKMATKTIQ